MKDDDRKWFDDWWQMSFKDLAFRLYESLNDRDAYPDILRGVLDARVAEQNRLTAEWTKRLTYATVLLALIAVLAIILN